MPDRIITIRQFRRLYARQGATEIDHRTYSRRVSQGIYPKPATPFGYTARQLKEYDEMLHRPILLRKTNNRRGDAITRTLEKLG